MESGTSSGNIIDLMEENIIKHQETLDPNEPWDFTDMMLIEIENTRDPTSSICLISYQLEQKQPAQR